MVFTKKTERPTEDSPGSTSTEAEERDFAAEDVERSETRAVKSGLMICTACGAQIAVPEP
jgi:RNA polymerase-binding transcription factor DksA